MSKVIHLEFKEPIEGESHFYFGSVAAIYDHLTVEQVGISSRALSNKYDLSKAPYENKRVVIRLGELKRKKGDRGRKVEQFFRI